MYRRNSGVSIIEAVVATAVLGIIVVTVSKFYSSSLAISRSAQVTSLRDQIYDTATAAINPESLFVSSKFSSPSNEFMDACIRPDSALECTVTDPTGRPGFFLMSAEPGGGATVIAGTKTTPRSYDDEGNAGCTGANCLFTATAYWWATCPAERNGTIPDRCPAAETIWVRVQVEPLNVGGPARKGAIEIQPFPPKIPFDNNPAQFAFPVATKDIRLIGQSSCGLPGSRMTGYDKYGLPICACVTNCTCAPLMQDVQGTKIDVSFGDCSRRGPGCTCTDSYCNPVTHFMTGLDKNNRAICVKRTSLEKCVSINIQTNGDCGIGSQMVDVKYGKCSHSHDPKGGGWEINCEDDIATCCSNTF